MIVRPQTSHPLKSALLEKTAAVGVVGLGYVYLAIQPIRGPQAAASHDIV